MLTTMKFVCRLLVILVVTSGILALAGGGLLGIVSMWRLHLIQAVLPKEKPLLPVSIKIQGPRFGAIGDSVLFHAMVSGEAGKISWKINPDTAMIHKIDESTIAFSTLDQGEFLITAVVGGDGKQSAHDQIGFESIALQQPQPQSHGDNISAMQAVPSLLPPPPSLPPLPPTIAELTLGAYNRVASENKAEEARDVAGTLYAVAKRIQSGNMPINADIPLEIEQQLQFALRDRFSPWGSFTVDLDTIIKEQRRQGKIISFVSNKDILMEIANTLTTVR